MIMMKILKIMRMMMVKILMILMVMIQMLLILMMKLKLPPKRQLRPTHLKEHSLVLNNPNKTTTIRETITKITTTINPNIKENLTITSVKANPIISTINIKEENQTSTKENLNIKVENPAIKEENPNMVEIRTSITIRISITIKEEKTLTTIKNTDDLVLITYSFILFHIHSNQYIIDAELTSVIYHNLHLISIYQIVLYLK